MKKIPLISTLLVTLLLASCGSKDVTPDADTIITPDTQIESQSQSAKVCEPFLKYLKCSIEKSPESTKDIHQKIYDDTQRKIENEIPARVAQECTTNIRMLRDIPEIAFKNGCTLDDNDGTINEKK